VVTISGSPAAEVWEHESVNYDIEAADQPLPVIAAAAWGDPVDNGMRDDGRVEVTGGG
jgi:hypothetical protein